MKFLTDENISLEVVKFLRSLDHDVMSPIEEFPSADDLFVLRTAVVDNRILITSDTDFGELVYHQKLSHKGVILLRLDDETNPNKIKILSNLLKRYKNKLTNNFVVATETKVRIRPPYLLNKR